MQQYVLHQTSVTTAKIALPSVHLHLPSYLYMGCLCPNINNSTVSPVLSIHPDDSTLQKVLCVLHQYMFIYPHMNIFIALVWSSLSASKENIWSGLLKSAFVIFCFFIYIILLFTIAPTLICWFDKSVLSKHAFLAWMSISAVLYWIRNCNFCGLRSQINWKDVIAQCSD